MNIVVMPANFFRLLFICLILSNFSALAQKTNIYIGVGKEGLAPTAVPHVMEVDANVLVEKIKGAMNKNVKVHFDYLPEEDHATVTHQAVFNALKLLYPELREKK